MNKKITITFLRRPRNENIVSLIKLFRQNIETLFKEEDLKEVGVIWPPMRLNEMKKILEKEKNVPRSRKI